MNDLNIIVGACREEMAKLSEQSVQCVVTSPPYWGQRDYGVNGMIGLEPDVHEWIDSMVEVFRGVWRVLRDDGTVWLNLGDKYNGSGGGGQSEEKRSKNWQPSYKKSNEKWLKQKDLIGLPWRLAFALQDDGWYLRRDIIWHKPNPMPESATDRPSTAHEYIFLLPKQPHYFYDSDAVKNPVKQDWGTRNRTDGKYHNEGSGLTPHSGLEKSYTTGNMRSVWKIATQPFGGAHYATYPRSWASRASRRDPERAIQSLTRSVAPARQAW